jgi:hypothetical protein
MSTITVPGPVTNNVRQGLILRMGGPPRHLRKPAWLTVANATTRCLRSTSSRSTRSETCSTRSAGSRRTLSSRD